MSGKHDGKGQKQGYTAAYTRDKIVELLRSGHFKSRAEVVAFLSHNALGKPENVDTIWVRSSRLNARHNPDAYPEPNKSKGKGRNPRNKTT